MTIGNDCNAPRWGGVARRSDSESRSKPQEIRGSDFRTLQVRARSSVNVSRTFKNGDTPLTQPVADLFVKRSWLLQTAHEQYPFAEHADR